MRLSSLAVLAQLVLSSLAVAAPSTPDDAAAELAHVTESPSLVPVEVSAPVLLNLPSTGPVHPPADEDMSVPPEVSLGEVVKLAAKAISSRNWGLFACAMVLGLVYAVRRFGAARLRWLRSDAAGMGLSLLVAAALQLSSALAAGQPVTGSLLIGMLLTAAGASGLFSWGKKLSQAHAYAVGGTRAQ
jgi:hypothetical protein